MSTATKDKKAAAPPEEPPKKSKKKLFMIIGVLVLLIGGYEAKTILLAPHYKPGQPVPLGKILPLDQITVNLADGHIIQASISLQLSVVATPASLSADLPRFDDVAVSVLGAQTMRSLLPAAGRNLAKAEILAGCQKIAGKADGAAQEVAGVLFTTFTMD